MAFVRALTLGVIIFPFSALAQDGTAVITGEVHDSTDARVAHAKAELRRERSGVGAISNAADAEGVYNFSGLRADRYTLKLSCPGFLSLSVKSISVVDGE
jgi:Carboxypeptidase regulatory-like domain